MQVQAWLHHRLAKDLHHLAHELLSKLIGASRETVTLLIHKFEEIGLLRREG